MPSDHPVLTPVDNALPGAVIAEHNDRLWFCTPQYRGGPWEAFPADRAAKTVEAKRKKLLAAQEKAAGKIGDPDSDVTDADREHMNGARLDEMHDALVAAEPPEAGVFYAGEQVYTAAVTDDARAGEAASLEALLERVEDVAA